MIESGSLLGGLAVIAVLNLRFLDQGYVCRGGGEVRGGRGPHVRVDSIDRPPPCLAMLDIEHRQS